MRLRYEGLDIPDVIKIEPTVRYDHRGLLFECYKRSDFLAMGVTEPFVQEIHTRSAKGVLRGLHYQKRERAQSKLVRVVGGEIFDVAVDLRRESPTYGRWVGARLSADNRAMLYVPAGFAHGFCALVDGSEVLLKFSTEVTPEYARGIAWNDPDVGIDWPINDPILSPGDASLPLLRESDNDF